ncbi:MAG: diguanylate cyclase, partial [Pseudomonadota bacterium]
MKHHQIEHFLHQTQIAGHISGRDIVKRIASAVLMTSVCVYGGFAFEGLVLLAVILAVELSAYPVNRRASQFEKPLSVPIAILVFGINWFAMLPFLGFAVVLSLSDTLPFILAGYLWAFGIYVHVSNSFGLLPLYNWSQMTVAFAAIFSMLWNLSQNPIHLVNGSDWWMVAVLTLVYIANTFDTMNLQKDTHQALERARQEASNRLAALERLSKSDSLTGLMNRRAFDEIVQSMMTQHANRLGVTVFMIDLDGFKPINDSYGHEAGDAVLCAIAKRLQDTAGKAETVARVGGDEFALLSTSITSLREARKLATDIIAALTETIPYEQKELRVGVSIGIARQGQDARTVPELLSGADQAMYLAKQDSNNRVKVYDKAAFPVRPTLEDRKTLLQAMEHGQIVSYYQPKVRLDTGAIVGFEALSRWHHPTRGVLFPADFLPMINELALQGKFMIHTANHVLQDLSKMVSD